MTIKALLPSPRYTGHDVTESVLRNIGNVLMNCIYKAVNVRDGVSNKFELSNTPINQNYLIKVKILRKKKLLNTQ
jgi:hypothetical protein